MGELVTCPHCGSTNIIKLDEKTKKRLIDRTFTLGSIADTSNFLPFLFIKFLKDFFTAIRFIWEKEEIKETNVQLEFFCLTCKRTFTIVNKEKVITKRKIKKL